MLSYTHHPPGFRDAASATQGPEGVPAHTAQAPPRWPGAATSAPAKTWEEEDGAERRTASAETQGGRGGGEEVRFYCCAAR